MGWNHSMPHNNPSRFEIRVTFFMLVVFSVLCGLAIWGLAAVVRVMG
jgi:hypothetical protein